MTTPSPCRDRYSDTQRREAADWFVIIHADDEPGPESLQAWLRWMEQDEGNRIAFESLVQAWHSTPESVALAMPTTEELVADTYDGERPVAQWIESRQGAERRSAPPRLSLLRNALRKRSWAAMAAASIAALILGIVVMIRYQGRPDLHGDEFTTKIGEQIEITLADGSRVWLGPRSRLLVAFSSSRRNIQLTAGEAYFSVKKDRSRPFVVRSAGGDITAVGTAFNVLAIENHVTVSVSEGVVTVAPSHASTVSTRGFVRVSSGEQVTFSANEPARSLTITASPVSGERARWRNGILIYRNESLREVIKDVSRYSPKQLEISGDAIGEMRYSGVVYTSALDEWMSALPESFPIRIVTDGNREIIQAR